MKTVVQTHKHAGKQTVRIFTPSAYYKPRNNHPKNDILREFTVAQIEKFLNRIDYTESCWVFKTKSKDRYVKYRKWTVHRLAFELFKGTIPESLTVDHVCFNKLCTNPDHLEAVTAIENVNRYLRSIDKEKAIC